MLYIYLGGGDLLNLQGVVEQRSGREVGLDKVLDDHHTHVRVFQLGREGGTIDT